MSPECVLKGLLSMPDPKRYEEFADLIRLHTSAVLGYVRVLLLNWTDAEDVFQETCLVLWKKFDEFKPGTNFLAWALRIAERKVMDFQKKQSRRMAFTAGLRDTLIAEASQRTNDAAASGLAALSGCIDKLPENDREMVTLCCGESIPVREVADSMGRSPQSVHHSLRRIRTWLLDCIQRELKQADSPAPIHRNRLVEEDGS
jgi:RNA polymerase sigma-70 factor, ECF subfamily